MWKFLSRIVISPAVRWKIGLAGGNHLERQQQLWEDLFTSSANWWDNRQDKRTVRHPDFRHKVTREPLWLNSPYKPMWVDSRLGTLDVAQVGYCTDDAITRLCKGGQLEKALDVLASMEQEGIVTSVDMYEALFKACARRKTLLHARRMHLHLAKRGLESNRFLGEYLVSTLVKCHGLEDALQVFHRLPHRTAFSWTALISGYTTAGEGKEALRMYERMRDEGFQPDKYTFVSVLKACSSIPDLEKGKSIHAEVLRYKCETDLFVSACLVDMYGKCGSVVDAQDVFDGLSQRDVVSWTTMLMAYVEQGQGEVALQLYNQMQEEGVSPDVRSFVCALQACGILAEKEVGVSVDGQWVKVRSLERVKSIEADIRWKSCDSDAFVGSTLVSLYGTCGSFLDAVNAFDRISHRDVVSWTAMLAAYVEEHQPEKALQIYQTMQEEGVTPDIRTLVNVFQACGMLAEREIDNNIPTIKMKALGKGMVVHAKAWKKGYDSDVFVGTTLISMYGKCGSIVDAQTVFARLSRQNVVSWTAMLAAYVEQGQGGKVLQLYEQMRKEGIDPDARTFVIVLQGCGILAEKENGMVDAGTTRKVESLERVKALHAETKEKGYDSDVFIGNSLITLYGKCGSIVNAQHVFDGLSKYTVVSWTAMIAAFVEQGQGEKALQLYKRMEQEGMTPDEVTLICTLQACSNTGNLSILRQIHDIFVAQKYFSPLLANTLIHAYARCASMEDAEIVFDAMPEPDVVSWNALIAGHARQGNCAASLRCYEEMQQAGMKPTAITFLSLLAACSHAGLVDKGVEYFESMTKNHGVAPDIAHYVSMVDLFGRAGCFAEVESLLAKLPMQPNLAIWLSLLGACQKHGNVALGRQAFICAVQIQQKHSSAYLLMWNIYADAGLWDHAHEVDELRKNSGSTKEPGQSWIQHDDGVIYLVVADRHHPQRVELYSLLECVSSLLEEHRSRLPILQTQ